MPRAVFIPKTKFKEANTESEMKEMFEDMHKGAQQRHQMGIDNLKKGVRQLQLKEFVDKFKEPPHNISKEESLKLKKMINSEDITSEADIDKYINTNHSKPSKKSPLDLLKEAREDKLISKKEYDILKDESPSKIKSRLKSLEVEVSDDDEPVVRATIDKDQYKAKPKPRKKQVAVKEIGHELHTRTHKMKKEPISKEEILNYVKMF